MKIEIKIHQNFWNTALRIYKISPKLESKCSNKQLNDTSQEFTKSRINSTSS